MEMVAEGVETTKSVYELSSKNHVDVPIVHAVYGILFDNKDPQKITYDLMTRDMKSE
jgi:glycerol-3-phosphate dehydrogenase (NAD(P)+)